MSTPFAERQVVLCCPFCARMPLVNRGIPAAALATLSKGEESPKYDNSNEEGRSMNRRAEFVIDSVSK